MTDIIHLPFLMALNIAKESNLSPWLGHADSLLSARVEEIRDLDLQGAVSSRREFSPCPLGQFPNCANPLLFLVASLLRATQHGLHTAPSRPGQI